MLRIVFAGTPLIAKEILQALFKTGHEILACFTQPDKPAGRGKKITISHVKQFAMKNDIVVYQPKTLADIEYEDILKKLKPDVVIVVAYGLIIPKKLLLIPKFGFINVHFSLLPRWRGAAPMQHTILAGDKITGVTIMQMDSKLDTGAILEKKSYYLTEHDTTNSLQEILTNLAIDTLQYVLKDLEIYQANAQNQVHSLSTYANKIKKQDAKINWDSSIFIIDRQIRAYNPWPVAYTQIGTMVVKIWQAIPIISDIKEVSGTIIAANKHGIDVVAHDGIVRLRVIQLPNKKPLPVIDYLNGYKELFNIGSRIK